MVPFGSLNDCACDGCRHSRTNSERWGVFDSAYGYRYSTFLLTCRDSNVPTTIDRSILDLKHCRHRERAVRMQESMVYDKDEEDDDENDDAGSGSESGMELT